MPLNSSFIHQDQTPFQFNIQQFIKHITKNFCFVLHFNRQWNIFDSTLYSIFSHQSSPWWTGGRHAILFWTVQLFSTLEALQCDQKNLLAAAHFKNAIPVSLFLSKLSLCALVLRIKNNAVKTLPWSYMWKTGRGIEHRRLISDELRTFHPNLPKVLLYVMQKMHQDVHTDTH